MSLFEEELLHALLDLSQKNDELAEKGEGSTVVLETVSEDHPKNEAPHPPLPSVVTKKTLFSHPAAHPIVLDLALLSRYGADWLEWEPETLRHYTEGDLGPMSDLNLGKIMACRTLHNVETYWKSWEVFLWCTMAFNSFFADFNVLQPPTPSQCLISADCAHRIRDVAWGDEVTSFLSVVFEHADMYVPLPPLEDLHVSVNGVPVDTADVRSRWPAVRVSGNPPSGDTVEDEQLRRLFLVHHDLQENRARLKSQLFLVQT